MMAIMIGLIIGIGLPIQTSINTRLRLAVKSPFVASLISFLFGMVFLALLILIQKKTLFLSSQMLIQQPIWIWFGGILGVIYLTTNILLFPHLGSIQTVIMPILGQILMGLLIDNFGFFDSKVQHLMPMRLVGAGLVVIGVVGAVSINQLLAKRQNKIASSVNKTPNLWPYRLVGVIAGMVSASQTAINGHLGLILNSPIKAAFISFAVGTLLLIILVLILRPQVSLNQAGGRNPWWMWFGGFIGAVFVLGNAYLVPILGTGLAVVIVLVGLIIGSLLIDQFGLLAAQKNTVTFAQFLSLLVMIFGVVIIRVL
ncbi:DMT family transporter [Companilactobacillus sp. FL22-1]|uniref:DMT family transporter n=1 Tax=Companilactobacillus sp. FL22-1 TaxID=3373892 RepID=UPI003754E274